MTAVRAQSSTSKSPKSVNGDLSESKKRFVDVVSRRIDDLMGCKGYSRDRATMTLLHEIGRGGSSASDSELFQVMTRKGLGLDDASRALVVSKALQRSMSERGFSEIEAIDDLTSKLSITKLLKSSPPKTAIQQQKRLLQNEAFLIPQSVPNGLNGAVTLHRKVPARKVKSKIAKGAMKNQNARKRSFLGENLDKREDLKPELDENEQLNPVRSRSDSLSQEVNAKLLSTKPQAAESAGRSNVMTSTGRKRNHVENSTIQSCTKRPREI
mmetsp:Transcript_31058/g.47052  ORF Transcript_31058/g.47052 Transcript_31058/m.47052 type:complete len:269 (-) Transcript_31058:242-1048(-)|eukprot:CAMPEP_0178916074 /NCGR_PEP_ID=MMETSP0786-20121207/12414_1 /TAXON_ID=186022 /ORGANISM="Thalassionema frauenfeldii, Strain CCMP 1798" /LENGTH=268 /DNA_ID=CAMNT_0020589323 /DNA_START=200 /DNA_END=1006 /DNA_ORIENTATION=-